MTKPGTALAEFDPTDGGKYCGAKTRPGAKHPLCRQAAGKGTDHVGQGRCTNHGGSTPITTGRGSRNTSRFGRITRPRVRDLIAEMEKVEDPLNTLPELAAGRAMYVDFVERWDEFSDALLAWHASFEAKYTPLSEETLMSFEAVIDEYEIIVRERVTELTERQQTGLREARQFVNALRGRGEWGASKPRKILDVSAAIGHLDTISRMAEREWKRLEENAISKKDLDRLIRELGLAVEKRVRALPVDDVTASVMLKALRMDWLTIAVSAA